MSRASTHWLLGVVLLASLGPAMAFACKPEPQSSWTMRSANGRVTLSMKGTGLTLRNARGKVLWKQDVPYFYQREAFISRSGRHVATVKDSGSAVIYGPKGKPLGTWSIRDALTKNEQSRLPESPCGPLVVGSAAFKGEVLELKVGTSGEKSSPLPIPDVAIFRLDPKAGKLTRRLPRNAPKLPELIQRWRSSPAGSERDEALEALSVRAIAANKPGALPELRSFWQEQLTAPGLQQEERAAAVRGLWRIGTDEEVRSLVTLLDTELGPLALEALNARLPRETEAHVSRILENPSSSEALRKFALSFLINKRPPSAAVFGQLLSLCQDPEPAIRRSAVAHLLHQLESRGPERKVLLAALRRADTSGKLEPFPEGWIILGGLAELEGKHPRALQLYTRGVTGLSSSGSAETRSAGSLELLFEALLQLAFEAKKQGKQDELSQRVHDVLSLPNAGDTQVSAPKPNRYARGEAAPEGKGAAERKSATAVARELTARTAPVNKRPKSKAPYDPFTVGP